MVDNKQLVSQLHADMRIVLEDCHRKVFAKQYNPTQIVPEYSDGSIFPVVTDDPRLTLPLQKVTPTLSKTVSDCIPEHYEGDENEVVSDDLLPCDSPLWMSSVREEVSQSRVPDHVVSTRKREQKFMMDKEQRGEWKASLSTAVPAILIRKHINEEEVELKHEKVKGQKTHNSFEQFASGWDLILPRGWATAFWIPLIYHRARAGGLREDANMHLESLKPHFPTDFPDTEAGVMAWHAEAKNVSAKYYRKPPAKRINFCVLGVQNPFQPDWLGLFGNNVKDYAIQDAPQLPTKSLKRSLSSDDTSGVVLKKKKPSNDDNVKEEESDIQLIKNEKLVDGLSICEKNLESQDENRIVKLSKDTCAMVPVLRDRGKLSLLKNWVIRSLLQREHGCDEKMPNLNPEITGMETKCLVCVSAVVLNKGRPYPCSMICMPTDNDLAAFCNDIFDPYKYGLQSVTGPVEKKHSDPLRKERKEARKENIKKRRRKKKKEEKSLILTEDQGTSDPVVTEQRPRQPLTFAVPADRNVIGYVTSGNFLFTRGTGAGIGFIALDKMIELVQLLRQSEDYERGCSNEHYSKDFLQGSGVLPVLALIRNIDSSQYRFVRLNIIEPS